MSEFLETLKSRLADAQRRHQEATRGLQIAQAHHQAITQELFGWQKAVEAETSKERQQAVVRHVQQLHQQGPHITGVSVSPAPPAAAKQPQQPTAPPPIEVTSAPVATSQITKAEFNKAEAIRDFMRQHPDGITPADIWGSLKDQIGNRVYVYAVLKRLKDTNKAVERRGKYFLREAPKPEEVKDETINIQ